MEENTVPTITPQQVYESHAIPIHERYDIIPECMSRYSTLHHDIKLMSDDQLRSAVKLDIRDERLRANFWKEVQRSLNTGMPVRASKICENVCTVSTFKTLCNDDYRLAFYFSQYINYESKTEALLEQAVSRYQELLSMDITSNVRVPTEITDPDTGKKKIVTTIGKAIDPKKAKVLLEVIMNIESRVKGTAVQRSVNVHETNENLGGSYSDLTDMSVLNDRLKELESRLSSDDIILDDAKYIELDDE